MQIAPPAVNHRSVAASLLKRSFLEQVEREPVGQMANLENGC